MAKGGDSGEKTELPTPKRLRDARAKGDVAKSKEFGTALGALAWLIMFVFAAGYVASSIAALSEQSLSAAASGEFGNAAWSLGAACVRVLLVATGLLLAPIAAFLLLAEALQIGPVFTTEKLKPSLDKMNPLEGLKRMFGKDGLVELAKSLAKALVLVAITWLAIRAVLPELGTMIAAAGWSPVDGTGPEAARQSLALTSSVTVQLLGWTVAAFLVVAVLDRIWTKHSFTKRMKMSRRDVKQEHKSDEGDPHVKSHRRELHREWSSGNPVGAARKSAALLVNPTHIAIALDYDADECPVPVIAAKGEGPLAAAMRAAASEAGVPIIRNVSAARAIWARGAVGDVVPEDLFDAVAEVILWAKRARDGKAPMVQDVDAAAMPARG